MIAIVGSAAIAAALVASVMLAVDGYRHATGGGGADRVRRDALVLLLAAGAAMALLEAGILSHDFTLQYVADNTATTTPFVFLLASGWAALEGSVVLWGLVLAGFAYLVARRVDDGDRLGGAAMAVIGVVAVFWFGLMLTASDPFRVCTEAVAEACLAGSNNPFAAAVAPAEGLGPNPLLQNHILMAIHPPMLYVGYVGMTVPFAFAIGALWLGMQGSQWLERTRRWALVAWAFLTLGILLGGWWSYEVLGWGGYWAWDPVENAAFIPWLVATAFIHSSVVQRRRGMLQAWNLLLIIATFSLTLFGTFLTRSGTVFSVHSFTQSPVGPALLGFLGVVVVGSLALFAWRVQLVASSPRLDSLASREGVFLANNLLLTVFAFAVLVGTIYPLILEAFSERRVTVGEPFYNRSAVATAFALLLAMGVGPVTPYRRADPRLVWDRIRTPIAVGLLTGAAAVVVGVRSVPVVIVIVLGVFVIATLVAHFVARVGARTRTAGESRRMAAAGLVIREPGFWGGQLSHLGVALAAIAIATTSGIAVRDEVRLAVGEQARVAGYCLEYEGAFDRQEAHRRVSGVDLILRTEDCGRELGRLSPSVNRFTGSPQPVGTPSVRWGLVEDVYVSITSGDARSIGLDVFVFPLQWLLWFGGLVTVAGALWALVGRRRSEPSPQGTVPPLVEARDA